MDAPGLVHHVWAHAIAGHDLFHDVEDRRDLLVRLAKILPDAGARCFGWTLMSNHLHAVVKTGEQRLGTLMQRVLTGYAMQSNGRAGRRGHLFQGRYGSRPLKDEADLHVVIRYVLRNPLEAGLVRSLAELEGYAWSGLGALLGRRPALPFESVRETLALFAPDETSARIRLRAFLERPEASADAVPAFDRLVARVCAELAAPEADVRGGRRTRLACQARATICRLALGELGIGVVDAARALGLSHGAVSKAARRPLLRK